jgi:hypothetical protein
MAIKHKQGQMAIFFSLLSVENHAVVEQSVHHPRTPKQKEGEYDNSSVLLDEQRHSDLHFVSICLSSLVPLAQSHSRITIKAGMVLWDVSKREGWQESVVSYNLAEQAW